MRRYYFNIWWCLLLFLCPFGLTANDFSLLSQGTLLLGGYGIFWGGASVRPLQLVVATTRALFWFRGLQVARGALLHKAMNAVGQQVLCTFPQYIVQRKKNILQRGKRGPTMEETHPMPWLPWFHKFTELAEGRACPGIGLPRGLAIGLPRPRLPGLPRPRLMLLMPRLPSPRARLLEFLAPMPVLNLRARSLAKLIVSRSLR